MSRRDTKTTVIWRVAEADCRECGHRIVQRVPHRPSAESSDKRVSCAECETINIINTATSTG